MTEHRGAAREHADAVALELRRERTPARIPSPCRAARPAGRAGARTRARRSTRRCCRCHACGCPRRGRSARARGPTASSPGRSPRRRAGRETIAPYGGGNAVLVDPAVHDVPVEVVEERVDVRRAVGLVVEEVGVLVDVERDERRRVPDRERVLRIADVVEEPALVPVVCGPGPAAAGHPGRLQVGAPGLDRAEVALHERAERARRLAPAAAQVREVELVVLDAADRERQVDLQRPKLRVHLVRRAEIDLGELAEDLVSLRDIALVELVVRLDSCAGDPLELVHLRPQLARRDLLEVEDERHTGSFHRRVARRREHILTVRRRKEHCNAVRTP